MVDSRTRNLERILRNGQNLDIVPALGVDP